MNSQLMVQKVQGMKRPGYEKSTNVTKSARYEKSMVQVVQSPSVC